MIRKIGKGILVITAIAFVALCLIAGSAGNKVAEHSALPPIPDNEAVPEAITAPPPAASSSQSTNTKTSREVDGEITVSIPKLPKRLTPWDRQSISEAQQYTLDCKFISGEDNYACRLFSAEFINDYISAKNGDRDDQDNVGYMLSMGGVMEGVTQNRLQGCAWKLVVVGSGGSQLTELDTQKMANSCGSLSVSDKQVAAMRAASLIREIQPHRRR